MTRVLARHATLTGAERELLLVALLASAVLGWRTARRLGVPDAGCAVGLLVPAAVLAVFPLGAVATPAALAVPWSALAAWTLTLHRPPRVVLGLAAAALAPAVLLAPDLLLVLVGAAGAALLARARRSGRGGAVATPAVTALTVAALAAVRLALPHWSPDVADTARWGGSPGALLALGSGLLLVAVVSGWLVPALRPPAAGLGALTVLAVVPPSARVAALVLAVPLAALLVADSAERVLTPLRCAAGQAPLRRLAEPVAAAALAVLVLLAPVGLATAARDDFGASAHRELLTWARAQLPTGTALRTDPPLDAELQHAGADAGLLAPGTGAAGGEGSRVLLVGRDGASGGAPVVARFPDAGRPLTVRDPAARTADADQLDRRRRLGAAVLANPTVVAPPAVVQRLRDGEVDLRLLTLLAGLVARSGVELAEPPTVPGEDDRAPVRSVVVAAVDGRPLTEGAPEPAALRGWLSAQQDRLAPDDVRLVEGGMVLHFRYVTDPDGVVTDAGG